MISAADLVAGPRGRRLCLELASRLDERVRRFVFELGQEFDAGAGASRARLTFTTDDANAIGWVVESAAEHASTADLAAALARVEPSGLTRVDLDAALQRTVDEAMYWQPPHGEDVLASQPAIVNALQPIAEAVAQHPPRWWTADRREEQWAIQWHDSGDPVPLPTDAAAALAKWDAAAVANERHFEDIARAYPDVSGDWWSTPQGLLTTTGTMDAATPAGLCYVEDAFSWEEAMAIPVRGRGRTYELHSAEDWAALCRAFPRDVTASRRNDWRRTTGRDGRWVMPDWPRVATEWDAVHLSARGYLNAATRAIDVDDENASVVAGWSPDLTVWLTDSAREWEGGRVQWRRDDEQWVRAAAP